MARKVLAKRSEAMFPAWERGLNPEQLEVVRHDTGPCRVLALAGSGKTTCATRRIARMTMQGVDPDRILAVTFSKKPADEMSRRVEDLGAQGVRVGTWHSLCLQILREDDTRWSEWTIDDKNRAKGVLKEVLGYKGMDWKGVDTNGVTSLIGRCKANLFAPASDEAAAMAREDFGFQAPKALEAFHRYNEALTDKELLTFDDFLVFAAEHLSDEDNRIKWSSRWDHLLCDEVQDNNGAQCFLARALAKDHNNYMAIGDVFQCIPAGQMVSTPSGQVPIERLKEGDEVLAMKGGKLVPRRIVRKTTTMKPKAYEYDLGEHGCFRATPEHILFAAIDDPEGSYVYLMYRAGHGFRIGVTRTVGYNGNHFIIRTQREGGERLWILDWFESYAEAAEQEAYWAYEYGVPREPFTPREGMWSGTVDATKRLFKRFGPNGAQLLADLNLDFDRPNYFAKSTARGRVAINLLMGTKDGHRVEVETGIVDPEVCLKLGMLPTGKGTYRTRHNHRGLREARADADRYAEALGGYVVECLSGTTGGRKTLAVPAASVNIGMKVPVIDEDGEVQSARVLGRQLVDAGECFDLEVDELGTFVVNGVVVHNSLFSFRGASPMFLANFAQEWPEAKTIVLPRNYRSGGAIIDAANAVLSKHGKLGDIEPATMIGERTTKADVVVQCGESLDDEARNLVAKVREVVSAGGKHSDVYALYRVNAQSRALEEQLLSARIPYVVVGGVSFYERKEVRDLLAYLRVATERGEIDDVKRCINAPFRFLGAKFVERVMAVADGGADLNWPNTIRDVADGERIQARQKASADGWAAMITGIAAKARLALKADATDEEKEAMRPHRILDDIVRQTKYVEWLDREEGQESAEGSGSANVREMIRVAERFPTMGELLDYVDETIRAARRQREDKQAGGNRVVLMTVFRAKGLESPHVFVCGMNEMVLPHARGEIDEERRIAYVAITRARDSLVLSHVRRISTRAGIRDAQPSRFLRDTGLPLDVPRMRDDDDGSSQLVEPSPI